MATAVSDSSVLIHLGLIGHLSWLPAFFQEVLVPPAVWTEVVEQGRSAEVVRAIQQAATDGWLKVVEPSNAALLRTLGQELHLGEAAAICLAVEQEPDVLLMDEADGREIAGRLELNTRGIVGLLLHAKRAGHLQAVKPVIEELVQSRFHLSSAFIAQILAAANEA